MEISTIGWVVASFGLAAAQVPPTTSLNATVSAGASAVNKASSSLNASQSSAIQSALNNLNTTVNGTNSTVVSEGILAQATPLNVVGTLVVAVALYALIQSARSLRKESVTVAERALELKTELVEVIAPSDKDAVKKEGVNPTKEMQQLVHSQFNAPDAEAVINQVENTTIKSRYNLLQRFGLRCMRVNLSALESLIQEERVMQILLTAAKIQRLKKENPHFDNKALSLRSLRILTSAEVDGAISTFKTIPKEAAVNISGDLSKFLLITGLGAKRFEVAEKQKIAEGLATFNRGCFGEDVFNMEVPAARIAAAFPA